MKLSYPRARRSSRLGDENSDDLVAFDESLRGESVASRMEPCTPRPASLAMSTLSSSLTASTSTSLARALNGAPALAQSLVLSRLASSPTLLPETLASLITAISLAARVSIKGAALFIEALLESARYSTQTSLGLTRRALISAVGSARALHYVNQKLDWSGRNAEGVKSRCVGL